MMAATNQLIFGISAIIFLVSTTLSGVHGVQSTYSTLPNCTTTLANYPFLTSFTAVYTYGGVNKTVAGTGVLVNASYVMIGAQVPYEVKNGGQLISLTVIVGACDPSATNAPNTFTDFGRGDVSK